MIRLGGWNVRHNLHSCHRPNPDRDNYYDEINHWVYVDLRFPMFWLSMNGGYRTIELRGPEFTLGEAEMSVRRH